MFTVVVDESTVFNGIHSTLEDFHRLDLNVPAFVHQRVPC